MAIKNTLFVGKIFHSLQEVDSTNRFALDLLSKSKPPEGTVVSAFRQTAGRGQIGRNWESEAGKNVTLSVIFYPVFLPSRQQFLFSQAVALSICDTLSTYISEKLTIKWPNDLYVGDQKIGGILIQNAIAGSVFQSAVVGIGINVNQQNFLSDAPNPTSFFLQTTRETDLPELIARLCQCLEARYLQLKRNDFEGIRNDYLNRLYRFEILSSFADREGRIFTGLIKGVAESGKLLIESEGEMRSFDLKEVRYL